MTAVDPEGRVIPAGELERRRAARAEQLASSTLARRVRPLEVATRKPRRDGPPVPGWEDQNSRYLAALSLKTGGPVVIPNDGTLARFRDGVDVEDVIERVPYEPEWTPGEEPNTQVMRLPGGVELRVALVTDGWRWSALVHAGGFLRQVAEGSEPTAARAKDAAAASLDEVGP